MLSKLLGKKKKVSINKEDHEEKSELTLEDLITLERYEEALAMIKMHLKTHPKDLHGHLRLADIHLGLKDVTKALDEYMFVGDSYADDGFFDKAIALLGKAKKLAPADDQIPRRIERYKRRKKLEGVKRYAMEGLMANPTTASDSAANLRLEVDMLWGRIVRSHLVDKLDGEMLKRFFASAKILRPKEGDVLAQAGLPTPQELYLVVSGKVRVDADIGGQVIEVRGFETGDMFGETILLEQKTWPATYTVSEEGVLFVLDREGLEKTMVGSPDPRGYISVLREKGFDRDVVSKLRRAMQS